MIILNFSGVSLCLLIVFFLSNVYSINCLSSENNETEKYLNQERNKEETYVEEINLSTDKRKGNEEKGNIFVIKLLGLTVKENGNKNLVREGNIKPSHEEKNGKLVGNSRLLRHRNIREEHNQVCRMQGACRSNYGKQIPNCYCDSDCITFNDCCWDSPYNSTSLTTKRTIPKLEFLTCYVMTIPEMDNVQNVGFYMVTKCPETTVFTEVYIKCTLGSNKELPVTDKDGVTYKNSECARCHGVTSFEHWNIMADLRKCDDIFFSFNITDIYKKVELLRKNNCKIYMVPSTLFLDPSLKFPRSCILEATVYSNNNPKCKSYMNTVSIYQFNNLHKLLHVRNYNCLSPSKRYKCNIGYNAYDQYAYLGNKVKAFPPLIVLFNFKTKQQERCSNKKDLGDTFSNANCEEETFLHYKLKVNVILESLRILPANLFHRATLMFYLSLPLKTYTMTIFDFFLFDGYVYCGINSAAPNTNCCSSNISLEIQFGIPLSLYQIEKMKSSVLNMKFEYKESQISTLNKQFTVKRKLFHQNDTCNLRSGYISRETVHLRRNDEYNLMRRMSIDKYPPHLNAERFPNESFCDVLVVFKNDSTSHDLADILEMKILNWTVSVLGVVKTIVMYDINIQIHKTILTYVTMSISTVTLCVTVGIYIYFDISKSLAGNVCTNVMITLIVANLLFMFGIGAIDNQLICSVLGIILHYIWLCVFNWINLYTLIVTKILIAIDKNPAFKIHQAMNKKTIYCLGYGIPVLIVVPCIILEKFPNHMIRVEYGGSICFLSGYLANIIFFTGPVVGSFLFNFALLIVALKMLRKYNYAVINKSTKKTLQYVVSFIKLCLISGLFWIFGIISEVIRIDVFEYLFIIIAGSQGLIVCLCFLTSFHVCVLCRSSQNTTHTN